MFLPPQAKSYVETQLNLLKKLGCQCCITSDLLGLFLLSINAKKILRLFWRNEHVELKTRDDNYFIIESVLNLLLALLPCFVLLCQTSLYSHGKIDVKVS